MCILIEILSRAHGKGEKKIIFFNDFKSATFIGHFPSDNERVKNTVSLQKYIMINEEEVMDNGEEEDDEGTIGALCKHVRSQYM